MKLILISLSNGVIKMITIAVHIVFIWILGLTMQASTPEKLPAPAPDVQQKQIIQEPGPVEKPSAAPFPAS
jgi:hypothetical protein